MRAMPLRFLTWGTITFAVGSAAWLSSSDQGALFCSVGYRATSRALGFDVPLSTEAVRAKALKGASAAAPRLEADAS